MNRWMVTIYGLTLVGFLGCVSNGKKTWRDERRSLAAAGATTEYKGPLRDLLEDSDITRDYLRINNDLLLRDTYSKQQRYKIRTVLDTNLDEPWFKQKFADSINMAVDQALGKKKKKLSDHEDTKPEKDFLGNIKAGLVNALVKSLKNPKGVAKATNKTILVHIYYLPEIDDPQDLSNQFRNNMLVQTQRKGKLLADMEQEIEFNPIAELRNSIPFKKPELSLLNDQPYEYVGGVISLYIKLLDLDWKPLQIPNPKKNALKGYIQFRRYFVTRGVEGKEMGSVVVKGETGQMKASYPARDDLQFVTVDAIREFNLEQKTPQLKRLEITFGEALEYEEKSGGIFTGIGKALGAIANLGKAKNKDRVEVPNLAVAYTDNAGNVCNYDTAVKKVIYNFETKAFDEIQVDTRRGECAGKLRRLAKPLESHLENNAKEISEKLYSSLDLDYFMDDLVQ